MRPPPLPTAPLFRPEAERFRRQRHLGTIILFRPPRVRLLALVPLAIVALLALGASRVAVQPRFAGLAERTGDRVTVIVDARAAGAIRVRDRVALDPADRAGAHGTVATIAPAACARAERQARCVALGIAPDPDAAALVPPRGAPLALGVSGPPRSYLSHVLDW